MRVTLLMALGLASVWLSPQLMAADEAYERAVTAIQERRWQAAAEHLEASGSGDELALLRGVVAYHLERNAAAIAYLRQAIVTNTAHPERACYYLMLAYRRLSQIRAAERMRNRVLSDFPNSDEAAAIRKIWPEAERHVIEQGAADANQDWSQGAEAFREGRFQEAEQSLRRAAETLPDEPNLALLRGMNAYHAGDHHAARTFLEAAEGCEQAARRLYYLGITLRALDEHQAASDVIRQLREAYPDSDEVAQIETANYRRSLHGTGELGYYYDDNPGRVSYVPDTGSANVDPDTYMQGFASLTWMPQERPYMVGGYVFARQYDDRSERDYEGIGLQLALHHGNATRMEVRYRPQYLRYGGDPYLQQHDMEVILRQRYRAGEHFGLEFAYGLRDFDEKFSALEGDVWHVEGYYDFRQHVSWLSHVRFELAWGQSEAETGYLAWSGSRQELRFVIGQATAMRLESSVKVQWQDYHDDYPGRDEARSEVRITVQESYILPLDRYWSLVAKGSYLENFANFDTNRYRQFAFGLGLRAQF